MDLAVIRDALAVVIRDGIARTVNVHARWPDSPLVLPAVVVIPAGEYVAYHEAFDRGLAAVAVEVHIYATGTVTGQQVIDDLLSAGLGKTSSVIDAIEANRSLGGVISDCIVRSARDVGRVDLSADGVGQSLSWTATVPIDIYLPRS
jgi:hypothetical protein